MKLIIKEIKTYGTKNDYEIHCTASDNRKW